MVSAWILSDKHKKGSENQCLGLVHRLKFRYKSYSITVKWWCYLIPRILWPHPLFCLDSASRINLKNNLPTLIIASGWMSAGIAAAFKKYYGTYVIYILNPKMPLYLFDYVIAPLHDQLTGPNVISVLGSLHPYEFGPDDKKDIQWTERWQYLKSPTVALLIGGTNKHYQLDDKTINCLASHLDDLSKNKNISLIITFSRRTTQHQRALLTKSIQSIPHWIWKNDPPNPYKDMLIQADFILITGDSVSMVSEACATGKPVYIVKLSGQSKKFDLFYQALITRHHARFFEGLLTSFRPIRLDETGRISKILQPTVDHLKQS